MFLDLIVKLIKYFEKGIKNISIDNNLVFFRKCKNIKIIYNS